jgi:ABC-2 type transport system ATP-binding protein
MLEIANLSHTYANGTVALADVNLSIPRGMFGLLGPNGAGKSTLMRTVATLQEPTAGSITFGDIDVLAEPERLRRTLGYLPQDFGVYPRVSAYAMLDQMAVLKGVTGKGERKSVVETLLNQTNLWAVRDKAIAGFSGGMRQRFGIAQALIGNPELIIVDEPTAGLDPEERMRFLGLLSEIGDVVDDVADVCQGMAILVDGQVRCQGDPRAVVAALGGTVWRKSVTRAEVEALRPHLAVLGTRWHAGRLVMHVLSPDRPEGFDSVPPDLHDLYFHTLAPRLAGAPPA